MPKIWASPFYPIQEIDVIPVDDRIWAVEYGHRRITMILQMIFYMI